jgi:predicted nuclease of predicted toxin-antitoxin system
LRWLLDAMLPPLAAQELCRLGHDAVSVLDIGMGAVQDTDVIERAVQEDRLIVTENFADFARLLHQRQSADDRCVPIVFVRREDVPRRGALAVHLARRLNGWATTNPEPLIGLYWP